MEDGNIKELSAFRFQKAVNNFEISKSLYTNGDYGFALNRAYYAAFDAMRAVNALSGFDSSKHSGVIAYFNKEYVKNGDFPPDTSAIVKRASMLREKSDYEDFFEPEKEDAETVINEVSVFIEEIRKYLIKNSIL